MKLYTKGGDDGTTSLFGGRRVPKDHPRVAAYGEVDELNAVIGLVISTCNDKEMVAQLRQVQSDLFVVGAELATPDGMHANPAIGEGHVLQIEQWIDKATEEVTPLKTFVLPGGCPTGAGLHLARTTCRRAERAVNTLGREERLNKWVAIYLNRLSDLLFALARAANHRAGVPDVPWTPERA